MALRAETVQEFAAGIAVAPTVPEEQGSDCGEPVERQQPAGVQDQWRAAWIADMPGNSDRYLALFNVKEDRQKVVFIFEHEMLRGTCRVRDLWAGKDLGAFDKEFGVELETHGAGLYRLSRQ